MSATGNPYGDPSYVPKDMAYAPADLATNRKLRTATKTFAIVLLVLGALSVFNSIIAPIFALIGKAMLEATADASSQNADLKRVAADLDNVFSPFVLSSLAASFLVGLGMVIGGIGTLLRKRWAAQLLRWCAGLMVILTLAQSAFQIYTLVANKDAMVQNFEEQMSRGGQNVPEGMQGMVQGMVIAQIFFAAVFALIFAAVYLWAFLHFSSPSTQEQFETGSSPAGSYA